MIGLSRAKVSQWAQLDARSELWKEIKHHVRTNSRFLVDLQKRMESLKEGSDEWVLHKVAFKRMYVLNNAQQAFQKAGGYSKLLVQSMDEGDRFLKMEPYPVEGFLYPLFLRLQRHEMHATTAQREDFWHLVSERRLETVGFENVAVAQAEIIGQKISSEAELSSSLADALKRWARLLCPEGRGACVVNASVAKELAMAWELVRNDCSELPAETTGLERALDQAKQTDNKVLQGFAQAVHGTALLSTVSKKLAEAKETSLPPFVKGSIRLRVAPATTMSDNFACSDVVPQLC